uniref:NADH-ubiquinone oxidoreductase chain 3 n=1 Tax=Pariaconus pele TaxID=1950172 RepID=A0A344A2M7_9HEMI|nr:NADH dehydrogenase subunit 3 [Pariaconus pele]AWU49018.1 NADH dehydrogenase subunit 3 [Pariaconus pele]
MYLIYSLFSLSLMIITLINSVTPLFNMHKTSQREKKSPFECGFDPLTLNRIPFSIHFFSISLMFLIFDIEITILMPLPIMVNYTYKMSWMLFNILMLMILILGLMLEWKEGSMEWK